MNKEITKMKMPEQFQINKLQRKMKWNNNIWNEDHLTIIEIESQKI